jgi:hypothetical protein
MMLLALSILFATLLVPDQALAWGGGMHLQLGVSVLSNLSALSPDLVALLASNPRDFLYGCISADITLGKKFTDSMLNCHRWRIGQKVLQAARTDRERACAYGYLCHLAADVIAHNYYVPYKIMRSFASVTMKHAYWEMRFETFVAREIWDTAQEVSRTDQRANDALMRRVLTNTIFSFGTNKRIFDSIMLVSRLEKWQKVMQTLSDNSRYVLAESDREEYLRLAEEAVFDFLQHPQDSEVLSADPTGGRALAMAEAVRKNLRLLYKNGRLTKAEGLEQVEVLKKSLRQALYRPELLDEVYSG